MRLRLALLAPVFCLLAVFSAAVGGPATITVTSESFNTARGFIPGMYGSLRGDCLYPYHNFNTSGQQSHVWQKIVLENDFIRVDVLPALGGRILRFVNKTTGSNHYFENPAGFKPNNFGRQGWSATGGTEFMMPRDEHAGPFYLPFNATVEDLPDRVRLTMVFDEDAIFPGGSNNRFRLTVVVEVPDDEAVHTVDIALVNESNSQHFMEFWSNTMVCPGPGNMRYTPRTNTNQHVIYPRAVTQVYNHNDNGNPNDIFGGMWTTLGWPIHASRDISRFETFLNNNLGYLGTFVAGGTPVTFGCIYNLSANEGIAKTFPATIRGNTRTGLKYWHWGNKSELAGLYGDGATTYMEIMTGPVTVFQEPANCATGPHPNVPETYGFFMNGGEVIQWKETYMAPRAIGDVVHVADKAALNLQAPAAIVCGNPTQLTLGVYPVANQVNASVVLDIDGIDIWRTDGLQLGPGAAPHAPFYQQPMVTAAGVPTGSRQLRLTYRDDNGNTVSYTQPITVSGACGPTHTPTQAGPPTHTPTHTATPTPTHTPTPPFPDTDMDGLFDYQESLNPNNNQTHRWLHDSDGDGLEDGTEDADRDGVFQPWETHPRQRDSDGDGLGDGVEVAIGTDPLTHLSPPSYVDADQDGLPASHDVFDNLKDTDGDRFLDGYEVAKLGRGAELTAAQRPALGDVNRDNAISNIDALMVHTLFLGLVTPASPGFQGTGFRESDANRDGHISNVDALVIQAFFLTTLPLLPL